MKNGGFTLIEVLVGTAVFLVVALAAYGAYVSIIRLANADQARILAVELADERQRGPLDAGLADDPENLGVYLHRPRFPPCRATGLIFAILPRSSDFDGFRKAFSSRWARRANSFGPGV